MTDHSVDLVINTATGFKQRFKQNLILRFNKFKDLDKIKINKMAKTRGPGRSAGMVGASLVRSQYGGVLAWPRMVDKHLLV